MGCTLVDMALLQGTIASCCFLLLLFFVLFCFCFCFLFLFLLKDKMSDKDSCCSELVCL